MSEIGKNMTDLQEKAGKSVLNAFPRTCAHRMVRLVKKRRPAATFCDEKIAQPHAGRVSLFGGFPARSRAEIEENRGFIAFAAAE